MRIGDDFWHFSRASEHGFILTRDRDHFDMEVALPRRGVSLAHLEQVIVERDRSILVVHYASSPKNTTIAIDATMKATELASCEYSTEYHAELRAPVCLSRVAVGGIEFEERSRLPIGPLVVSVAVVDPETDRFAAFVTQDGQTRLWKPEDENPKAFGAGRGASTSFEPRQLAVVWGVPVIVGILSEGDAQSVVLYRLQVEPISGQ